MQQNPYDFIFETPTKPKKGMLGGNSQKNRILQVVIAGGILLVLGLVLFSVLSNLGKGNVENLYKIAAAQEDLISITDQYGNGLNSNSLQNQSATLNLVLISQNRETSKTITNMGIKKPSVEISKYKVSSYKKVLDDAKTKGTFEDAYATLLANRIDDYRIKLNSAYSSSSDEILKTKLVTFYQQINIIAPLPDQKSTNNPSPTPTPSTRL
jgi:hypothetical protein